MMNSNGGDVVNALHKGPKDLNEEEEEAMNDDRMYHKIPTVSSFESSGQFTALHDASQPWYMSVCHACMDVEGVEERKDYHAKAMWTAGMYST